MYFRNLDFLIDLSKIFNELGIFSIIFIIYAIIQFLSKKIYIKNKKGNVKNTGEQYNVIHIYNINGINVLVSNDY